MKNFILTALIVFTYYISIIKFSNTYNENNVLYVKDRCKMIFIKEYVENEDEEGLSIKIEI